MRFSRFSNTEPEVEEKEACSPQITSLLDIMTILLIYLLKSFSSEGNLITPSSDLNLPLSTARNTPQLSTTLKITKSSVLFNDSVVVLNKKFENSDDLLIAPLFTKLSRFSRLTNAAEQNRDMMLQADKDVEFSIIKRVMYTCSKAGFSQFTVLVLQEG